MARLIPHCVEALLASGGEAPKSWSAFLEQLQLSDNPYSADILNSEWSLASAIIKGAGRKDESICPPDIAWKAVVLLAILNLRVRPYESNIAAELGQLNPEAFRLAAE